jgi:hypothetical protein
VVGRTKSDISAALRYGDSVAWAKASASTSTLTSTDDNGVEAFIAVEARAGVSLAVELTWTDDGFDGAKAVVSLGPATALSVTTFLTLLMGMSVIVLVETAELPVLEEPSAKGTE